MKFIYCLWFLERYYIGTTLLVKIHITRTQKWASGYNPTLLFCRRTERRNVYKLYELLVSRLYLHTIVGRVVNCTGVIYGGRTRSAAPLRRYIYTHNSLNSLIFASPISSFISPPLMQQRAHKYIQKNIALPNMCMRYFCLQLFVIYPQYFLQ